MIENNQAIVLWKRCLNFIKDNVNATAYKTWFEPVVPLKFEDKALTIGVPSPFFSVSESKSLFPAVSIAARRVSSLNGFGGEVKCTVFSAFTGESVIPSS